jgi:hypothetical protein
MRAEGMHAVHAVRWLGLMHTAGSAYLFKLAR